MRIPRIYVDLPLAEGTLVDLPDTAFQHVCKVLRFKEGKSLIVFNGEGGEFSAILQNVEKRRAQIDVKEFQSTNSESPLQITLGQVLSRGERMDYAIQKAVEAGVQTIQPLFSERCEVKLNAERMDKRVQHWQQVAISAAEQSGRCLITRVLAPITLSDWLETCSSPVKITMHPHKAKSLKSLPTPAENNIAVLVGPEGGLSDMEIQSSIGKGFQCVTLGPRILRTETAPVVILTALNLLWGDL